MTDHFDVVIGWLVASWCGLCLMVSGVGIGRASIEDNCKTFGAFKSGNVVYECKEKK